LLTKCIYPQGPQPSADGRKHGSSSPCKALLSSPDTPSYLSRSPSSELTTCTFSKPASGSSDAAGAVQRLTESDLYDHYVQHTSRTLTHLQQDQSALQIGIPDLALRSNTVLHALLAVSAACLCCDLISGNTRPNINAVNQILMIGYEHYNLASEQIRESISGPDAVEPEPLLASAGLLVPFATASQQINHWISRKNAAQDASRPLSTTPRDVIIIMRGIRATRQSLACASSVSDLDTDRDTAHAIDSTSVLRKVTTPPATPAPSRAHVMYPILATTSQKAFSVLQERLDSASLLQCDHANEPLSACRTAYRLLANMRDHTFSAASTLNTATAGPHLSKQRLSPQAAPWLRSFAGRSAIPQPTEPLTVYLLTFLVEVPQTYLDLVLPLLDQRLESPAGGAPNDTAVLLSTEQALALDIYAHWSVFMLLVEVETWWIGNLPTVTLTGMMNRYGNDFVARLWPEQHAQQESWWPGDMLSILQGIKRYR
jgi:hypothetical protein